MAISWHKNGLLFRMKHPAIFLLFLPLILFSCSQLAKEEKIPGKDTLAAQPVIKDSLVRDTLIPEGAIYANESDTSILLQNGEAYLKGHISPKASPRKYALNVTTGQTITATVKPLEKNGNVRITQLQLPDKSFEGPFGDSLTYVTKSKGALSIIVGQNMMAGDPWTGSFILHVTVK